MGPVSTTVVTPGNVTLTCMADGVPAPNITWLRVNNSMLLSLDEVGAPPDVLSIDRSFLDERTAVSTLNLFGVQPLFAGNYTCRAVNLLGMDTEVATVTVHGMLKFSISNKYWLLVSKFLLCH